MSEKTINCLIVVDSYNTVNGNEVNGIASPIVYMLDDNGDQNQGSNELTINAEIGDTINFNVASIIPSWGCVLTAFVPTATTTPDQVLFAPSYKDGVWTGTVQNKGKLTYHFKLTVNGYPDSYEWDPFIVVT